MTLARRLWMGVLLQRAGLATKRSPSSLLMCVGPLLEATCRTHGRAGCAILGGWVGETLNRQGTALLNQGVNLLNHGVASKTMSGVRLELARRGWQ